MSPSTCAPGILNSTRAQWTHSCYTFISLPLPEAPKFPGWEPTAEIQVWIFQVIHNLLTLLPKACQSPLTQPALPSFTLDTPKLLWLSPTSLMTYLEIPREHFKSEPEYYFPPGTSFSFNKPASSVYCYPRGKCISLQLTELDISECI